VKKTLIIITIISIIASISLISLACRQVPAKESASATVGKKENETTVSETTSAVTTSSDTTSTEATVSESTAETASSETTSTTSASGLDANLTQQEVIDIAMNVADGTVERVETEIEDGRLVWKVRIISGGTRTDVRIDDLTGEVVRVDTKDD
jgi:uncharacterized membrane protein YkoI